MAQDPGDDQAPETASSNHVQSCKKTVVIVNCCEKPMETQLEFRLKQWQPKLEASKSCRHRRSVSGTDWGIFQCDRLRREE